MDLETLYIKFLHEKPRHWTQRFFFNMLKMGSFAYLAGWWVRKTAYRSEFFSRNRLGCPVISVGNLSTGGTGKTPVVIALARHFCAEGKRVAVLSRGYRRKAGGKPIVWVSDGEKLLASPEEGGDEPVLIAQNCPRAAVVVGADRYRVGQEVLQSFRPDLIILDDGFQRRFQLHRDLDILIIDGLNPFSTGWVLPAGLLREPLGALAEADVLVLNKANQARSPEDIKTVLRHHNPRAFLVESRYHPSHLRNLETGKEVRPGSLDRLSVGAFSGVANPLSFIRTLAEFKVLVRHAYTLRDHYPYTREKLEEILRDAKMRGLGCLVTTQKDEVKLPKNFKPEIPILVLDIHWRVTGGKNHWDLVLKNISLACSPPPKTRVESE